MGWKERFTFREKHAVEHEVCGSVFRFYPNRIRMLQDLAEVAKPIGSALAGLFAERDYGSTEKVMSQEGTIIKETSIQAATVEVLKHRAKERDVSVEALLSAVSDPRNRLMFGRLLMDSLREEFNYHPDRPAPEVEAFLYGEGDYAGLDLPALSAMVAGWVKANAKQFGSVGEQIAAEVMGRIGGAAASLNPLNESPSTTAKPEPGSSSKTPSSPESPADSL